MTPSAWQIEQAIAAWQSARSRLLADDADLAHDEAALVSLLGSEDGDIRDILGRLLQAEQHASSMADAATEMVANLTSRRDRYKRRKESLRSTMFAVLDATGSRREEFPHGTISLSAGREAAVITDETALPERFIRIVTTSTPDRPAILAALKDGEVIEGAALSNTLPILSVRSK